MLRIDSGVLPRNPRRIITNTLPAFTATIRTSCSLKNLLYMAFLRLQDTAGYRKGLTQ